jgi:hypothetical protein
MKNNKKFLVIVIVLIVVILFVGVYYFMGKSSNSSVVNLPKVEENLSQENQVVSDNFSECLPTTAPWIKVLSPNGGETYTAGQQITVKWKSCNNPYMPKQVFVRLSNSKDYYYYLSGNHFNQVYSPDTGSLTATIPAVGDVTSVSGEPQKFVLGNDFKITVVVYPQEMNSIEDSSDNFFTINSKNISKDLRKNGETCGDGIGNCQTGLKCGYPCGIQGCQNVCMPENELPKP